MEVKFTFEVRGEHFVIFEIAPLGQGDEQGETSRLEAPVVDHSNH
jgi:Cu(I)/Ag(I) efflux system membrane fusion protein